MSSTRKRTAEERLKLVIEVVLDALETDTRVKIPSYMDTDDVKQEIMLVLIDKQLMQKPNYSINAVAASVLFELRKKYPSHTDESRYEIVALDSITNTEVYRSDEYIQAAACEAIMSALQTLTPRQEWVIREYYLKGNTLLDISKTTIVGSARIGQIKEKALRCLRHPSRSRKLAPYLSALQQGSEDVADTVFLGW